LTFRTGIPEFADVPLWLSRVSSSSIYRYEAFCLCNPDLQGLRQVGMDRFAVQFPVAYKLVTLF
jgi:hypothetical protein